MADPQTTRRLSLPRLQKRKAAKKKAKAAKKAAKKASGKKGSGLWGGLLGKITDKRQADAKDLSTLDTLRRLEGLLVKLDEGNLSQRVHRTPVRELEHILGALNPIELSLSEPFRRFEAPYLLFSTSSRLN